MTDETAPSSDAPAERPPDLLPVRMVNEYAYCPRLFHFMHVEGVFEDNHYTVEGRTAHRRVDQLDHVLPDAMDASEHPPPRLESGTGKGGRKGAARPTDTKPPDAGGLFGAAAAPPTPVGDGDDVEPPTISRSVPLASEALGLTGKLDLVSTDGEEAVPVETKRGRVPENAQRSWEPERVQLMAQGLMLREAGYKCDHGVLYFAGSRTRVTVMFTAELEERTLELIGLAREAAGRTELPDPLEDSPKCPGCSLVGVCLPDETLALKYSPGEAAADGTVDLTVDGRPIRRLYPVRDDATPLYIQEHGARVGTSKGSIIITDHNKLRLASGRLHDTSQLVLCGNISISAQALHVLAEASIPIVHLTMGHWFHAITQGHTLRSAFNRSAQFEAARDPAKCLAFARQLVIDKAANQRTLLRRNAPTDPQLTRAIADIDDLAERAAPAVDSLASLLGVEGSIAAHYFGQFSKLLKSKDIDAAWDFARRNRRPPADPVNALLSFGYALLSKECTVALLAEGLDPWWGLYHQPRHGRPALALDIMEPFRPAIVDSAVITAINTGMVAQADFSVTKAGCVMQPAARKGFIRAYEARLDQLITHPQFDYRCSWRVVIRLQARLLARWLRGDIHKYESVTTR